MASRKVPRSSAADSFVTLTFTSPGARMSAQDILAGTASLCSASNTPSKLAANSRVNRAAESNDKSTAADSAPIYTTKSPSHDTSPTASPLENSMSSIKYSTPSTSHSVGYNDELGHASTPKLKLPIQVIPTSDEHNQTAQVNDQRRSSTASLTDGPTRSSRRVRKLTSKAQALADTNTLPSFQPTTDIEMETEQGILGDQVELEGESLQEKVNETNKYSEDQASRASPTLDVIDTPIESVEITAIRTSPRERKPTARAVESDLGRNSRKRTCSPVTTDRVHKIAKTTGAATKRSSNLRFSTEMAPNSPPFSTKEKSSEVDDDKSDERNKSQTMADDQVGQESNEPEETPVRKASNDMSDKVFLEAETSQMDRCDKDLNCLSPSSRLLAFAYAATASPDSDDETDDVDEVVDFDAFYTPLTAGPETYAAWTDIRHKYCQCSQNCIEAKSTRLTALPPKHPAQTSTDSARKVDIAAPEKRAKPGAGKRNVTTRKTRSRVASQEPTISKVEARSTRSTRLSSTPLEVGSEDKKIEDQVNALERPIDISETTCAKSRSNISSESSKNITTVTQDVNQANTVPFEELAPRKRHKKDMRASYDARQSLAKANGNSVINDTDGTQLTEHDGPQTPKISLHHKDPIGKDSEQSSPIIPPSARITKKMSTKSTDSSTPGGGKRSSAGGSVRLSLQNHERESVHKNGIPVKVPTPGPPTSIKLRFTTSAK